jgi:hypothetical protein
MENASDRRRTPRLFVNLPVTYEVLATREPEMPKDLAEVYERVHASTEQSGQRVEGVIRDLSINGAFINGPPVALLTRVSVTFPLPGLPRVEGIGWTLWRRKRECVIQRMLPGETQPARLILPEGFGILFESITADARRHIERLIRMHDSSRIIMQQAG